MRVKKVVTISHDSASYIYNSPEWDDLNEVCDDSLSGWEPESRRIFRRIARDVDCILDIGAYTGVYSIEAAISNPRARVIAVEPNSKVLPTLSLNIACNDLGKQIEIWNYPLSNRSERAHLHTTNGNWGNSMTSLRESGGLENKIEVETRTLDSHGESLAPGLVKIDVEGFEPEILLGAEKIFRVSRPIILMEALSVKELDAQIRILKVFNYSYPKRIAKGNGDDRNYLWLPTNRFNNLHKLRRLSAKIPPIKRMRGL